MTATVEFDFDDVVSTVKRFDSRANLDDAEEAVQVAVERLLRRGEPLIPSYVVMKGRSALSNMVKRSERGNASLDRFLEADADEVPVEIAVDEVDYDSHARLAEARRNPVLRLRLELVEQGQPPLITDWSRGLVVEAIKAFVREEGRRPNFEDVKHDPRLPSLNVLERLGWRWGEALDAAGVEWRDEPRSPRWTREKALDAFRDYFARMGRLPTTREFRAGGHGLPSYVVLERLFSTTSMRRMAELAGIDYA